MCAGIEYHLQINFSIATSFPRALTRRNKEVGCRTQNCFRYSKYLLHIAISRVSYMSSQTFQAGRTSVPFSCSRPAGRQPGSIRPKLGCTRKMSVLLSNSILMRTLWGTYISNMSAIFDFTGAVCAMAER